MREWERKLDREDTWCAKITSKEQKESSILASTVLTNLAVIFQLGAIYPYINTIVLALLPKPVAMKMPNATLNLFVWGSRLSRLPTTLSMLLKTCSRRTNYTKNKCF